MSNKTYVQQSKYMKTKEVISLQKASNTYPSCNYKLIPFEISKNKLLKAGTMEVMLPSIKSKIITSSVLALEVKPYLMRIQ